MIELKPCLCGAMPVRDTQIEHIGKLADGGYEVIIGRYKCPQCDRAPAWTKSYNIEFGWDNNIKVWNALVATWGPPRPILEVVSEMDKEQMVYLGSHIAFFEVCKAGDITEEFLNKLSETLYDGFKERLYNAKRQLEFYKRTQPDDKEIIKKAKESVKEAENKVKSFVPLCDRMVEKVYNRVDRSGINVIVPGSEVGRYWHIDEKINGVEYCNGIGGCESGRSDGNKWE